MKKSDFQELARLGVRQKLEALQDYLAEVHAEFPDEFSTPTPPMFLRPTEKVNGNSWPSFAAKLREETDTDTISSQKASWTPERRAAQGERMRGNSNRHGGTSEWGSTVWHRIHDYLLKQPKRTSTPIGMAKGVNAELSAVTSALARHKDRAKRIGPGTYRLVKPITREQYKKEVAAIHKKAAGALSRSRKAAPARDWGAFHWQKIHDYLKGKEDRTAGISEIMKALKIPTQASAITSMQGHKNLFRRTGKGTYQLIAEDPAATSS